MVESDHATQDAGERFDAPQALDVPSSNVSDTKADAGADAIDGDPRD